RRVLFRSPTITIFCLGFSYRATCTGVYLKSGCFDRGSILLLVRLLARAKSCCNILPQCIGRNTTPCFVLSEICAHTLTSPCLLDMITVSFCCIFLSSASWRWISKNGLGVCCLSLFTFPVRVMVCH